MTLAQLNTKFENLIKDGVLNLSTANVDSSEIRQVIERLPKQQLLFNQPKVSLSSQKMPPTLSVTGDFSGTWNIPGVDSDIKLVSVKLSITKSQEDTLEAVSLELRGTLHVSMIALPIILTLTEGGTWLLNPILEQAQHFSLLDFVQKMGGTQMTTYIPAGVEAFEDVSIDQLEIEFSPEQQTPTSIKFAVVSDLDWEIVPNLLVIKNIGVGITIIHFARSEDHVQTSSGGAIFGSIQVDSTDYNIVLYLNGGRDWTFEIVPDEYTSLPSLSALATLIGGENLGSTAAQILNELQLGALSITGVKIGLNLQAKTLNYISIASRLNIVNADIETVVQLPDFYVSGALAKGNQIELITLVHQFVPVAQGIPPLTISDFGVDVGLKDKSFSIYGESSDTWLIPLEVTDLEVGSVAVSLESSGVQSAPTGEIAGTISIGDFNVALSAQMLDMLILNGEIPRLELTAIIEKFLPDGVLLPDELPNVEFSDIALSITPTTGEFSLSGTSTIDWDFNTGRQKLNTQVDLTLNRSVSNSGASTIDCNIALKGEGLLTIVDELILKQFSLDFNLDGNQEWSLSGDVTTILFDKEFQLAASYTQTTDSKNLTLTSSSTTPTELLNLAGLGSLNASSLAIAMSKQNVQDRAGRYVWNVSANGRVRVEQVFDFAGNLTIYQKADQTFGLNFLPTLATVNLPLAVPPQNGRQASLNLNVGPISIVRKASTDQQTAEWAFESSVVLAFKDLPQEIQELLPAQINTYFKADTEAVSLTVDRVLEPIELPIPDIEIDRNTKIPLGTAALDASDLSILFDVNLELSAELGLGLPAELNKVFGVKADGTPAMNFFKVYNPADRDNTLVKLKLSVGTAGIKINPLSSPIEAIRLVEEAGKTWCNCDFDEFGQIKFQVPEFSLDTTTSSFTAKGGFETVTPLKLPLTPFKSLLSACDLQEAATSLPNSLPLKIISILDEQNNFKVEELIGLLEEIGGTALPSEISQTLRAISSKADQLPDRLKHYLNIEIPDSFLFDIAITPDGGVRINVRVKDGDPPVKLLSFGMYGGIPFLQGIELRSFSFGTILSGTLFLLEVDARFDQFDLVTLASSLLLPQDGSLPLPSSRELHRRLIIDKLFMIIVYQTKVPIPIPLFFDQLGVEYLGFEGVALQSHVSFPMPKINLMEVGQILSKLKQFFTDQNYLLDPNDPPSDMNLTFTLGKNYIQLPKYLGHEIAGSQTDLLKIDAYQYTARLLNGLKTLSLNDLVQALPLEYRVGRSNLSLACLAAEVTWLLTTPDEFRQIAYQRLNIATHEINHALAVLPPSAGTSEEQGLVTFLKGNWAVANLATFEAMFGLIASGSAGFHTGFKIAGMIANFMDLELSGRIAINPPQARQTAAVFQLAGHSHLTVLGHQIFLGDIQIVDNRFQLKGKFDLFPENLPLVARGNIEGWLNEEELYLAGDIETALADITLVGAKGVITNDRITLQGTWLGVSTILEAENQDGSLALRGAVALDLFGLRAAALVSINSTSGAVVRGTVDNIDLGIFKLTGLSGQPRPSFGLQFQAGQVTSMDISGVVELLGLRSETRIGVSGAGFSFHTIGKIFNQFDVSLEVRGAGLSDPNSFTIVATLQNDLLRYLKDEATKVISQAVSAVAADLAKAQQDVANAQREVDKLNSDIAHWRGVVGQERAGAQHDLQVAQQAVSHEQRKVDDLLNQIRYREREIERIRNDGYYGVFGIWFYNDPLALAKIAALGTEIGALYAAYGVATAALETAKAALELVKGAVVQTPIDLDPRISHLFIARDTATAALTVAQEALRVLRDSVGAIAQISDFIAQMGLNNVLEIRAARFESSLSQVAGGQVAINLNLRFMNDNRDVRLDFNFNNPLISSQALGQLLLPS